MKHKKIKCLSKCKKIKRVLIDADEVLMGGRTDVKFQKLNTSVFC